MTELDIWQEMHTTHEGIGCTTYSQRGGERPVVEDESWVTWDELESRRTE